MQGQAGDADLAGVRAAVVALWEQLDQEMQRAEAGMAGAAQLDT